LCRSALPPTEGHGSSRRSRPARYGQDRDQPGRPMRAGVDVRLGNRRRRVAPCFRGTDANLENARRTIGAQSARHRLAAVVGDQSQAAAAIVKCCARSLSRQQEGYSGARNAFITRVLYANYGFLRPGSADIINGSIAFKYYYVKRILSSKGNIYNKNRYHDPPDHGQLIAHEKQFRKNRSAELCVPSLFSNYVCVHRVPGLIEFD